MFGTHSCTQKHSLLGMAVMDTQFLKTIVEKVMKKTDLPYNTAGDLRSAGDPSPAIDDFKNYAADVWFCFPHNFSKNYLQDLKIVQNDAPHDSLQSALKIKL